jgi:hypothetical protein
MVLANPSQKGRCKHDDEAELHTSEFALMKCATQSMCRVSQNRVYTPYMTVYFVFSLPNIPYVHRIYMVLAIPINVRLGL